MINKREQEFLISVAENGKTYISHPRWFRLSNGTKYMPDFYCKEDDCYIEISGTRQAYHGNKEKYERFKKEYPHLKFKIVHLWKKKSHSITSIIISKLPCGMRKQMLGKLTEDRKHMTINALAQNIGLPYTTMYRILAGHKGNIDTWEKIDAHYKKTRSA